MELPYEDVYNLAWENAQADGVGKLFDAGLNLYDQYMEAAAIELTDG